MTEQEKKKDNRAKEIWSQLVETHGDVGNFEEDPYLIGGLSKGEASADVRLHKKDNGYMVYVNDFGAPFRMDRAQAVKLFVEMIVELVKKLRLEGIQINWVNVQGSRSDALELRAKILEQL